MIIKLVLHVRKLNDVAVNKCHPTADILRGYFAKETVVLRRRGVETNVWFINRVEKVIWPP